MSDRSSFRWDWRSLLWAAMVLAGAAAFSLLVARPQMARARELATTVHNERADLAARYQSLDILAKSEKEAAALVARTADFDQRIPPEPLLGSFLEDLARVAQKRGLHSDTIQPGDQVRLAEVVALPLAVKLRGSFAGSHGLLQDIEQMPRLTRFDRLRVLTDPGHSGVTAELNLRVFFRPPESGAKTG